jgi:hypothetical protein
VTFILSRDDSPEQIPYLANRDSNNNPAVPTEQYVKVNNIYLPVSATNPLPTQLTGSKVSGPTLILTVPYSNFVANTNIYPNISTGLSLDATRRIFTIDNELDQPTTGVSIAPYVSGVNNQTSGLNISQLTTGIGTSNAPNFGGNDVSAVDKVMDACTFIIGMGATVPTSGNLYVYVTEVFG